MAKQPSHQLPTQLEKELAQQNKELNNQVVDVQARLEKRIDSDKQQSYEALVELKDFLDTQQASIVAMAEQQRMTAAALNDQQKEFYEERAKNSHVESMLQEVRDSHACLREKSAAASDEVQMLNQVIIEMTGDLTQGIQEISRAMVTTETKTRNEIEELRSQLDSKYTQQYHDVLTAVDINMNQLTQSVLEERAARMEMSDAFNERLDAIAGDLADVFLRLSSQTDALPTTTRVADDIASVRTNIEAVNDRIGSLEDSLEKRLANAMVQHSILDDSLRVHVDHTLRDRALSSESNATLPAQMFSCDEGASQDMRVDLSIVQAKVHALAEECSKFSSDTFELQTLSRRLESEFQELRSCPERVTAVEELCQGCPERINSLAEICQSQADSASGVKEAMAKQLKIHEQVMEQQQDMAQQHLEMMKQVEDELKQHVRLPQFETLQALMFQRFDKLELGTSSPRERKANVGDSGSLTGRVDTLEADMKQISQDNESLQAVMMSLPDLLNKQVASGGNNLDHSQASVTTSSAAAEIDTCSLQADELSASKARINNLVNRVNRQLAVPPADPPAVAATTLDSSSQQPKQDTTVDVLSDALDGVGELHGTLQGPGAEDGIMLVLQAVRDLREKNLSLRTENAELAEELLAQDEDELLTPETSVRGMNWTASMQHSIESTPTAGMSPNKKEFGAPSTVLAGPTASPESPRNKSFPASPVNSQKKYIGSSYEAPHSTVRLCGAVAAAPDNQRRSASPTSPVRRDLAQVASSLPSGIVTAPGGYPQVLNRRPLPPGEHSRQQSPIRVVVASTGPNALQNSPAGQPHQPPLREPVAEHDPSAWRRGPAVMQNPPAGQQHQAPLCEPIAEHEQVSGSVHVPSAWRRGIVSPVAHQMPPVNSRQCFST